MLQESDIVLSIGSGGVEAARRGVGPKGIVMDDLSEGMFGVLWIDGAEGCPSQLEVEAECDLELVERVAPVATKPYTVIGVHDNGAGNRFAETYDDINPAGAEDEATAAFPDLLIAGVVEGDCNVVDNDPELGG